jgi:hypothetical protein
MEGGGQPLEVGGAGFPVGTGATPGVPAPAVGTDSPRGVTAAFTLS